jgi:hypothetical protein
MLVEHLWVSVSEILPAVHAVTGCDTTTKVGTKHATLIRAEESPQYLMAFGKEELPDTMLKATESFLALVISINLSS